MMLVKAFENVDGKRKMVAEGDVPEAQVSALVVGQRLNITRVVPSVHRIGSTQKLSEERITIAQYEILSINEEQTEINTPFIAMDVIERQVGT